MDSKRIKRVYNELEHLKKNLPEGFTAEPGRDMFQWKATIKGPEGSPYEGGTFRLSIEIPPFYPYEPPNVKFTTKIYHPNIHTDGKISLDILGKRWSPILNMRTLLLSICSLLADPNGESPLEHTRLFNRDRAKFDETAKQWTKQYAMRQEQRGQ